MARSSASQNDAELIHLQQRFINSSGAEDLPGAAIGYTFTEPVKSSDRNKRASAKKSTLSISSLSEMLMSPSRQQQAPKFHVVSDQAPRFWRRFTSQDYWALEIFSCAFSLTLLIAILVIGILFDGKPLPQWQYHITLNTIISVLATLVTFTLIVPVTAGLGQLKWIRFRQRAHKLSEFEAIDRASRGPTGSIVLLVKRQGGLLAIVGSVITLVNLATNPFFQQIVHYENHLVPSTSVTATLPVCIDFDPLNLNIMVPTTGNSDPLLGAIFSGIFTGEASTFQVIPDCATNNCTWSNAYQTLGVCSECKNISDQVKSREVESEGAEVWYLPNGFGADLAELNISNTYNNYNYGPDFSWSSVAFSNRGLVVVDFFSLYVSPETYEPIAYECVLQYCLRTYMAETKKGVFTETLLKQWTNDSLIARDLLKIASDNNQTLEYPLTLTSPEHSTTFSISMSDVYSLFSFFSWAFVGNNSAQGAGRPPGSDISYYLWPALKSNSSDNISAISASLAASMTLYLRNNCNGSTNGVAYAWSTFVQIEYAWIALPATLYLLVVLFFGTVVVYSSRHDVEKWGDSGLPVLFHGLDERSRVQLGALNRIGAMDEAAEELVVKMAARGCGLRLSAMEDEDRDG